MAQAQKPSKVEPKVAETPVKTESPMKAGMPKDTKDGQMVVHPDHPTDDSPSKAMVKGVDSRSAPNSPATPDKNMHRQVSPGERGTNQKAEVYATARSKRVEVEAQSYIDSEVRKAEAHAEKEQAMADKNKMHQEAKAAETLKKEELRADTVVHQAELKAEKMIAAAKEKCAQIKAIAKEECEKHIAEANTHAEQDKASLEEGKERRIAVIKDKAETWIAAGELAPHENKGVGQKIKEKLICHSN